MFIANFYIFAIQTIKHNPNMKRANLKIISELKNFLFEAEENLKSLFVKNEVYFTRERKITFVVLIL